MHNGVSASFGLYSHKQPSIMKLPEDCFKIYTKLAIEISSVDINVQQTLLAELVTSLWTQS